MRKNLFVLLFTTSSFIISCQNNHSAGLPKIEWEAVHAFTGRNVVGLSVDSDNTIYAICRQNRVATPIRLVLYKSSDGANWDSLAYSIYNPQTGQSGYYGGYVSALAIHNGTIFVGTSQTEILVKYPQDKGFVRVLNDDNDDIVQFTFSGSDIFASGLRSGLYESTGTDKGWKKILGYEVNFNHWVEVSSVAPAGDGKIFVGTQNFWGNPSDNSYILSSSSPYQSWSILRSGTHSEDMINCLAIDKNNNILAGTEYGGMIYSFDDGKSWTTPDTSEFKTVTHLAINSSGHIFASIFKRPDQNSGSPTYSILRSAQTNGSWNDTGFKNFGRINMMKLTNNGILLVATSNGLYRSVNSTETQSN